MPNLRGKTWTTTTPANVGDAQYWEDHLISDEAAQKAAGAVQSVNNTLPDENGNINITPSPLGPTVVDSLNSTSATDALSANQGHALKDLIEQIYADNGVLGAKNRWNFPAWKGVGLSDATATWDDDTYTLTLTATANSGRSNITVPVDAQIDVTPEEQIKFVWDSTGSSSDGLMTFDVFKVGDTSAPIASAGVRDNELIMTVPANCYKLTYRVLSGSANKVIKIANCMCICASDPDDTYVPYAMTNKELTEDTQELKYRVGILSTPVPAYVARCTPPRFKNVTDDWENGTLRDEIAAGNFKNVVPCDYLKYDNTYIWFAEPDGMLGKGDQTNATYQAQAYGQHHIYAMVKYMGDTRLWAGYGNADKSWRVSANDKGRCPWNAATDVDPTDSEAIGTNSTNITRTYNSANVSGYMGSFIRERMDAVILPYLQTLLGSANILLFRNINGNAVVTDKPSGGQGNWNGCTSGWDWYGRYLDLPSEVEIYGSRVFGSAYDIGAQCEQLAMFKNARIHDIFPRIDIWTKAVASSSRATVRSNSGLANSDGASFAFWACPLVCIR